MNAPFRHPPKFDFGESLAKGGARPVDPQGEIAGAGAATHTLRRKTIGWYVDDIIADPMTIPAVLVGGTVAILVCAAVAMWGLP